MFSSLKEHTSIQFGCYYKPSEKGEAAYLQAKNFNDQGSFLNNIDVFIQVGSYNPNHLLLEGDILFVGKGFRTFACCYHESFGKAIASSIFFVLRINSRRLLPEYLTTILNLPQSKLYFQRLGAGSSIPSIRKIELEEFSINIIPVIEQERIIKLSQLHIHQQSLTAELSSLKQELFQVIVTQLINKM